MGWMPRTGDVCELNTRYGPSLCDKRTSGWHIEVKLESVALKALASEWDGQGRIASPRIFHRNSGGSPDAMHEANDEKVVEQNQIKR